MGCRMCGGELRTSDNGVCPDCKNNETNLPFQQGGPLGWICPKCGSVYGPSVWCCTKCTGPGNYEMTFKGGI